MLMSRFLLVLTTCLLFLFGGCNNKPPDDFIDQVTFSFLTKASHSDSRSSLQYENIHTINGFADENLHGYYYVDISCILVFRLDRTITKDSVIYRFTFIREGDQWVADKTPSVLQGNRAREMLKLQMLD